MSSSKYIQKLAKNLFLTEGEQQRFTDSLNRPQAENALVWLKPKPDTLPFPVLEPLAWQPDFVSRVDSKYRPGAEKLHEDGVYYVLDMASVFMASVFLEAARTDKTPKVILDCCASPGGKAVFAWRLFKPELLVCNETIGKRIGALVSNLKRCDIKPVWIVNKDLSKLGEQIPNVAELVIVDAPCSGQSLFAKGKKSPGAFHPATVNLNSNRQKRIIANAAKLVAPKGYLAYMTCTYSREENEGVVEWLLKRYPEFTVCEVPELEAYRSGLAKFPAYRLWPQQGEGAGGFSALLRRDDSVELNDIRQCDLKIAWSG